MGELAATNQALAERLAVRAGVMVLASSAAAEPSFESEEWGHGAFTKALLEALAGEAGAEITAWAAAGGAVAPVTTSRRSVEAIARFSSRGLAVILINWANQPVQQLTVRIRDARGLRHVQSARLGKVEVREVSPSLIVRLPMQEPADVLLVTK